MDSNQPSLTDVYNNSIKFLSRREYSAAELKNKLKQQGFTDNLIAETLNRLQAENLQSDKRFVEMFIRTRQNQGYGPVRIEHELQQKGIDSSLSDEYLLIDDEVWFELAKQVRIKKFGTIIPQDYKSKAKQMSFLQYRGFAMSHIDAAF